MKTDLLPPAQLSRALERNEAFWTGTLVRGPLLWITVPAAVPGAQTERAWTDVEYATAVAGETLCRSHYAGDALPVRHPWLGPDQFAAWLGAELTIRPEENTSWVKPFISDWTQREPLVIDPRNRWWQLYLELVRASVEAGRGKWVTAYPDIHSGIDGLSAIRGPDQLAADLLDAPAEIHRAMTEMTAAYRMVVDTVSDIIVPAGQGTSNWTMGWSAGRFGCIGQNDFSCMIGPDMFREFCLDDTTACVNHLDRSLYHLDGPGAVKHLSELLAIKRLDCIQWIQGAGNPPPSRWLPMLQQIQAGGKSVQLFYGPDHGDDVVLEQEIDTLCRELDPSRLFFWIIASSAAEADFLARRFG